MGLSLHRAAVWWPVKLSHLEIVLTLKTSFCEISERLIHFDLEKVWNADLDQASILPTEC